MATHLRRVPTASLSLQRVGNGAHMASGTSGVWLDFDYTALSPEGRLGAISALCEELSEVNTKLARAQNSLTSLEVEHGNLQWEADGWSSSEDEGDGDGGFAVRTPAPVVAAFNALTVEVLCSTAPAKRMKIVMDELPLALALDPDMQTRFPAHLSRDWARKEQALLSAWLVKTENVRTLQELTMAVGKKMKGALTIRHETVGDKVEYFATGSWRRVVRVALPSNCIDVMLRLLIICGARLTKPTKKGKRVLDVPHVDVLESWFGAERNPAMVDSLHRNVLTAAARPANRTEALARLPDATSKHLKETGAFNYRIFAELESYLNKKVCQVVATAAQPKKSLNGVRGIANVLVSARHPCTVTLTPTEATIAQLKMSFSFSGAVRSTDTDKFNPLFDHQPE